MDSIRDSVTLLSRPETTVSRTERGADQMALNVIYAVRNVFKRIRILMKESFWIVEPKRGVALWWIYASFWVCFFPGGGTPI